MDGWMDGWCADEWRNGWMDGWMDGWCADEWRNGWMDVGFTSVRRSKS